MFMACFISENEPSRLCVVTEFYENILAANVFVRAKHKDGFNYMKITIGKETLILTTYRTDEKENEIASASRGVIVQKLTLKTPEDFFIPMSFYIDTIHRSNVYNNNDSDSVEIQCTVKNECPFSEFIASFRLQVSRTCEPYCETARVSNAIPLICEPQRNTSYTVVCTMCKAELSAGTIVFEEISEIETKSSELSEIWFCHGPPISRSKIDQSPSDLLFTINFYILCCLKEESLLSNDDECYVYCSKCSTLLGRKRYNKASFTDGVFCFKDRITFLLSVEDSTLGCPSSSKMSLSLLLKIIEKTLETSPICKLVLEAEVPREEKSCLLLTVMNHNLKLSEVEHCGPLVASEHQLHLAEKTVMKLLYCCTVSNSQEARRWLHQFSVDHYYISDVMFQETVKFLSSNSASVMKFQDIPSGFACAYLPTEL